MQFKKYLSFPAVFAHYWRRRQYTGFVFWEVSAACLLICMFLQSSFQGGDYLPLELSHIMFFLQSEAVKHGTSQKLAASCKCSKNGLLQEQEIAKTRRKPHYLLK